MRIADPWPSTVMMLRKRVMRAVVMGMAALAALLVPSTASAQWRWLEKLSGPGPFVLTQFEQKLWCGYEGGGKPKGQFKRNFVNAVLSAPCVEFNEEADLSPLKRKWAIGVGAGLGVSLSNGLQYAEELTAAQTRVYVAPLEVFAEFNPCAAIFTTPTTGREKLARRLCRRFDIAGVAGMHTFFGRSLGNVVPVSHHFAFGPRASAALMTFGKPGEALQGAVRFRFSWMRYPSGFDDVDFGAIPGTWHVPHEWVRSWSLVVDLDRLR